MDDNTLPPDPEIPPPSGGIPDDDEFLNSLFASSRPDGAQPPQTGDRGGKARDRYQKRREKNPAPDIKAELKAKSKAKAEKPAQASEATPSGGTRRVRAVPAAQQTQPVQRLRQSQVGVPGGFNFKLKNSDLKKLGPYAYVIAGLVVLVGGIIFLGIFRNRPAPSYPNGIWIGDEWTFDAPSNQAIVDYAQKLRDNRIGTVYAWVSSLKGDNAWSGKAGNAFAEMEPNVISFVSQFRAAYPQATLYGWIGFPVDLGGTYRLSDPAAVAAVAAFAGRVVKDLGFDGVMLDAEIVWNERSEEYIALLQAIRREIGDAPLAVAVIPDWSPLNATIPVPSTIAPGTEYSLEFKQRIALLTDQIMVMAYNSNLNTPLDYVEWVAYQTQVYANAVADVDGGASVLIGIPTYNTDGAHDVNVENIPSAISGVIKGLQQAGAAARVVDGVAIYRNWETDEDEWRLFQQFWVQR